MFCIRKVIAIFLVTVLLISEIFTDEDYPDVCPNIISKNQWGARGANQLDYAIPPIDYVIIHHTITPTCENTLECSELLKEIQNFHMDTLKFDDIGYNFVIGGDGQVYEGRGWHVIGAHTKNYNSKSIGVAFLGTFTDVLPTNEQLQAGKDLLKCAEELMELNQRYILYGARQVSATQSPGLKLYNEIQKWPHFTKRI